MRNKILILCIVFGLLGIVVQQSFATMLDVLPGTPAAVSGLRVEKYSSFGPGDEWTTDITEQDWSRNFIVGMGYNSLNFYFSDLTDYIHTDVYTLGDTQVTDGGIFSFTTYGRAGNVLNSEQFVLHFGQYGGAEFTSLGPQISRLEVRFFSDDAGGFVSGLSYNLVTPEPATLMMFGIGVVLLIGETLRRKNA